MRKANRQKKKNFFSFIIIPHGPKPGAVSFKAQSSVVYSILALLLLAILISGSALVYSSSLTRKLVNYWTMRSTLQQQQKQIEYFGQETDNLKKALTGLEQKEKELRKLLGLKAGLGPENSLAEINSDMGLAQVRGGLSSLRSKIEARKLSLENLNASITQMKNRFAATPSIWPAYGRISAGFGYRLWYGIHTGVDIASWHGSPVRAAAAGRVTYAGWKSGYGKTVTIDHDYGLLTLYGHNSKLLVSLGARVKKGQVIACVGTTGLATGPHLHYEVQRRGQAVNPVRYLNLDIFTAGRVW